MPDSDRNMCVEQGQQPLLSADGSEPAASCTETLAVLC